MNIHFEPNFQLKYMVQSFLEPTLIDCSEQVMSWRKAWLSALTSWHSPYKAVVDCSNLSIQVKDPQLVKDLEVLLKFFKGFHLREVIGFSNKSEPGHQFLPFKVLASEEEAFEEIGIRKPRNQGAALDFRSNIQLQNHFQTHVVELNFREFIRLESKDQVQILKSKLTNNLMQWHSKWSLLVDCANLEMDSQIDSDFELMIKSLRGFFLKTVVGYSPHSKDSSYPFDVYRARHRAVALLEGEGNFSGDKAECQSRRKKTP